MTNVIDTHSCFNAPRNIRSFIIMNVSAFSVWKHKCFFFIEIICLHETPLPYDLRVLVYCEICYSRLLWCYWIWTVFKHYVKQIIQARFFYWKSMIKANFTLSLIIQIRFMFQVHQVDCTRCATYLTSKRTAIA